MLALGCIYFLYASLQNIGQVYYRKILHLSKKQKKNILYISMDILKLLYKRAIILERLDGQTIFLTALFIRLVANVVSKLEVGLGTLKETKARNNIVGVVLAMKFIVPVGRGEAERFQ